jgi:hypothetical protein
MTIYVYSANPSHGAKDLCEVLGAIRLRQFDGLDFRKKNKKIVFTPDDVLICWGSQVAEFDGPRILNAGSKISKKKELEILYNAGIQVPYPKNWDGPVPPGWIGRKKYHVGGSDLLNPDAGYDFLVQKLDIIREFRAHIFNGKTIKAGIKQPRDGFFISSSVEEWQNGTRRGLQVAHPWVRSYDAGWRINYDGFKSDLPLRQAARAAVKTLGLTFGAVDLAEVVGGFNSKYVLEVNRAPGGDPPTIEAYAKHIKKWIETGVTAEDEEVADNTIPAARVAPPTPGADPFAEINRLSASQFFRGARPRDLSATVPRVRPVNTSNPFRTLTNPTSES